MNSIISKNYWNPWTDEAGFQRAIDRLFGEMMPTAISKNPKQFVFNPTCDVEESDTHYLFSFDLPGLTKNDIKVELIENQLLVSGERKNAQRLSERYYGSFQRAFTLPMAADAERVEASYENGVLKVAVPKTESAKNRTVKVTEGKNSAFGAKAEGNKRFSA